MPLRLALDGARVALAVVAVQEAGSVALGGLLIAALLAPSVIVAPFAGVALDRARRPRALVLGSALVVAAALAIGSLLGILPTAAVVVALLLAGCCTPAFGGGLSSFAADVIPGHEKAFASDTLSYNIAGVAGPAIAALALASASGRVALQLLAAVALVGAAAVLLLALPPRPVREERAAVLTEVARGTRHMVGHRPLALSTLSGTLTQLGGGGLPIAAVALAAERASSEADAGWIVTAFSVGGLIGALWTAWRPVRRWTPHRVMLVTFGGTGIATIAAGLLPGLPLTLVAMAVAGLFTAPGVSAMQLIRHSESPAEVRSQVFTVGAGLRGTAGALGAAVFGALGVLGGVTLTVLVGVVWVVSAAILLIPPGRRLADA
ncbi:MFS transporter [Naasia sp. SYSU D00057]|uniref:MFS transporter n=1 Tax=Naasia sp. SYSU D00057 TaxID=2817380 RepID=UPI001B311429|nr:MFS transporter [Naasia sp. SYSU D00057]